MLTTLFSGTLKSHRAGAVDVLTLTTAFVVLETQAN
jgi:hypothetical protein